MAPTLLGPPEIHHSFPIATAKPPSKPDNAAKSPSNPFVSLMHSNFNAPPMGLTENFSPTFLSTGNACLDFFFYVVPDTPPRTLIDLLRQAWAYNPLTTLKLICNLRGVRGTGKSDREGFYTAALWLHQDHPKTRALNIRSFADIGYLKDLLEILFRRIAGDDVRKKLKEERGRRRRRRICRIRCSRRRKKPLKVESREERIAAEFERVKIEEEKARELRRAKRVEMARRAFDCYHQDADYRQLHDRVADFFAELLLRDMEAMKSGKLTKISLAAKWCPSLDSSFDRSTMLCESIAPGIPAGVGGHLRRDRGAALRLQSPRPAAEGGARSPAPDSPAAGGLHERQ